MDLRNEIYYQYAEQVTNGEIVACKYVIDACKRFLNDLNRDDLIFRKDKVERAIKFIAILKHFKGKVNGKPFILEPFQQFIVANLVGWYWQESGFRRFTSAYIEMARKGGKALSIDTKIPTPNGWTTMGDLQVGDYVFGADGKPTMVTYTTDVMYNHTCYDVAFEDGDSVIADADHNWCIKTKKKGCQVMTTQELVNSNLSRIRKDGKGIEYMYRIPMNKPVEYDNKSFAVDPYILGLWLGDGHVNKPTFTVSRNDLDMYEYVTEFYGDYHIC